MYRLTPDAIDDIDGIWTFIARNNPDAADRVEQEILNSCERLTDFPFQGHVRQDLTSRPLRFWTVSAYPNYIIVYRPETKPLEIIRVLHGRRDLKRILGVPE